MDPYNPQQYPQQYQQQYPQYQQPYPQYQQAYPQYQQRYQPGPQPNLLVYGILSLAITIIAGIILGAIGRSKGNAYIAAGGTLTGASKVGYIFCKIGFIVSIVATAIWTIYMIVALAEALF